MDSETHITHIDVFSHYNMETQTKMFYSKFFHTEN